MHCVDLGPFTTDSVDYPDYAEALCQKVLEDSDVRGILLCGTGIGMSMAANRHPKIFATLCNSVDDAKLARQHGNSNVIVMGARKHDNLLLRQMVNTWVETEFEGGRHTRRLDKIDIRGL